MKKILASALSIALTVSFCVPAAATEALGSTVDQIVLPLSLDGGTGDVVICVEQDRAATVKAAATECRWVELMDVDASAVPDGTDQGGYELVELISSSSSGETITKWAENITGVVSAEENSTVKCADADEDDGGSADEDEGEAQVVPTNYYDSTKSLGTYSNYTWFLHNNGTMADGAYGFDIDVPDGVTSTSDQVVAIIDSGVAYDNPALADYMIDLSSTENGRVLMESTGANKYGISTVSGTEATDNYDETGHGTHCAGIVTQVATQGGTAGSVRILDVRAGDNNGYFTDAALIKACQFVIEAREAGINVVAANMSLGGGGFLSDGQRIATAQMAQSGVACAVASGNTEADGDTIPDTCGSYNIDGLLLVGASDPSGSMASYTTYGARSVSVIAPGSCILSTFSRSKAQFVGQTAVQNTLNGETDCTQALYNEGFEDQNTVSAKTDPNIGGSVSWSYATCTLEYGDDDNTTATIKPTGRALNYSIEHSFQGTRSLKLPSGDDAALVSGVFDSSMLAKAEALNMDLWTNDDYSLVSYFFVDENGTVYGQDIDYSRACVKRSWVNLNSQELQLLPQSVRDAAQAGHSLRLVLMPMGNSSNTTFYVDDICLGCGVDGYAMIQGTSMATPMVAGTFALLAAAYPEASATELAARVCGGATYDKSLDTKCTTSGFLNVAGAMNPKPAIQSTSVDKNVLTINGYFFGEKQGTVKVGSTEATIDSWNRLSGNLYSVQVDLPGTVVKGNNTIWVTSAEGRCGRTVINLAEFVAQNNFKELPQLGQEYNDRLSSVTMCATTKTLFLFGTSLDDRDDNEATNAFQGKIEVITCTLSNKTYHDKGYFQLGKLAGFKNSPELQEPRALVIGGVPYLCGKLNGRFCVFKYLTSSNSFKLIKKTTYRVVSACTNGTNLYLATQTVVKNGKCAIKALRRLKNGSYAALRKVNLKTGGITLVGAVRIGAAYSELEYEFCMAGGYLVGMAKHQTIIYTASKKLSALSTKRTVYAKQVKLTGMDQGNDTNMTAVGKRIAFTNAYERKSTDTSSVTRFFNPATGKWVKSKVLISPYTVDFISMASCGTTLYVRGQQSATINPHINFIKYYTF